jgi:hypothetical protein
VCHIVRAGRTRLYCSGDRNWKQMLQWLLLNSRRASEKTQRIG